MADLLGQMTNAPKSHHHGPVKSLLQSGGSLPQARLLLRLASTFSTFPSRRPIESFAISASHGPRRLSPPRIGTPAAVVCAHERPGKIPLDFVYRCNYLRA